jgi:predicted nucleotidyltransferase
VVDFDSPIATVIPGARGVVLRILAATDVPLTGNKIAELSGGSVSQSGVSKAIAPLVASGLVLREQAGSAHLYTLNRDHVAAPAVITAASVRDELFARMTAVVESWQIRPIATWIFGSVARGQATPSSDLDVLVIRPDAVPADDDHWEAQSLAFVDDVRRWSGNVCQILEYSETEYSDLVASGDRLARALRDDAVVLTGRSPRQMASAGS